MSSFANSNCSFVSSNCSSVSSVIGVYVMSNSVAVKLAPTRLGPTAPVALGLLPSTPFHYQSHFLDPVIVEVTESVYV